MHGTPPPDWRLRNRVAFALAGAVAATTFVAWTPAVQAVNEVREPTVESHGRGDQVEFEQSADKHAVRPGGDLRFTVKVTNKGTAPVAGIKLVDDFHEALSGGATYNDDAISDRGTVSYKNGKVLWTGDLDPGQGATFIFSIKTNPRPREQVSYVAYLSRADLMRRNRMLPGDDPDHEWGADTMGIVLKHSAQPTKVKPGGTVSYKVVMTPERGLPAEDVTVKVELARMLDDAGNLRAIKATLGTVSRAGTTLIWKVSLPAKTPATLSFDVTAAANKRADDVLHTSAVDDYFFCETTAYATCRAAVTIERPTVVEPEKKEKRKRHKHHHHFHEKPPLKPHHR